MKKKIQLLTKGDRRLHNSNNTENETDNNLTKRIKNLLRQSIKNVYRIPLRFLTEIGLINHTIKIDTKIICILKTDLSKLFKSNKVVITIADPDVKIIWHDAPYA